MTLITQAKNKIISTKKVLWNVLPDFMCKRSATLLFVHDVVCAFATNSSAADFVHALSGGCFKHPRPYMFKSRDEEDEIWSRNSVLTMVKTRLCFWTLYLRKLKNGVPQKTLTGKLLSWFKTNLGPQVIFIRVLLRPISWDNNHLQHV